MSALADVALPVFAIILAGYLCGRASVLGDNAATVLNGFVYYVAMPALFIASISGAGSLTGNAHGAFLAVVIGGQMAVFGLSLLAATVLFPGTLGAHSQHALSATLTNSAYMGIPLMQLAYGDEGALLAIIASVANGVVFMSLGTVLLEISAHSGRSPAKIAGNVVLGVVKSPLVLGAAVGVALLMAGITLPSPAQSFVDLLGATAGPCALFAIGLFLVGKRVIRGAPEVAWISFMKLIMLPLLTWVIVLFLVPLSPLETAVAVLLAALPTGSLVFVLGERYGEFMTRSVATVLVTTVLSVITVSALLAFFAAH